MSIHSTAPWPVAARLLSLVRIVAALVLVPYGLSKLTGWPAPLSPQGLSLGHAQAVGSLMWTAGVIEVAGGLLLALGLFTRPVAFLLSGELAVAYFMRHGSVVLQPGMQVLGLFPSINGGTSAVLYSFLFLYIMAAGPGAWSLDGRLMRRQR